MSTMLLLKKGHEAADAFNEVKRQKLMRIDDVRTTTFLAAHCDIRIAAQETAAALMESFKDADVRVRIDCDPETGDERLAFELLTSEQGKEARKALRQFVREALPASAITVRDHLVFGVIAA